MTRASRLSPNQRGALWLLGSSAFFAAMNGVIKYLGPAIPTPEAVLFRTFFGFVALSPFILADPWRSLYIRRPGLHLLRAGLGLAAMSANFWTVAVMPLATATTLFFTKPLFMPFLAALFLGETFRKNRLLAALAGFSGVLIMLGPPGGVDLLPVSVGLGGALCVALVMVVVKKLATSEEAMAVLVWFTMLSTLGILPVAIWVWVPPSGWQWVLLILLGGLGSMGQYMMIRAYQLGETSAITPVDYTQLIFASLFGFVVFGELPGWRSWAGIAVIMAATLYISLADRNRSSAAPRLGPDDLL